MPTAGKVSNHTADQISAAAAAALAARDVVCAESLCRTVIEMQPAHFVSLCLLGDALAAQSRVDEALAAWERAAALNAGHSIPFSRIACARLRRMLGPSPRPKEVPAGSGRIQMTSLGADGRFGNQLLQYGFLRLYARRHGFIAETPDWIGRQLYGCRDPWPSRQMPRLAEEQADWWAAFRGTNRDVPRECDLRGYFCGHTTRWGDVAPEFRALFEPVPAVRVVLETALSRLESGGRTVVAVHIRRGDFGYGRFWIAPVSWYLDWLRAIWPQLYRPVLYLATDDVATAAAFSEFSPVLAADLQAKLEGLFFILDHFILSRAVRLAISNSSFSFTAAMLNTRCVRAMRPDPNQRRLVPFDPWAAEVLLDPELSPDAVCVDERSSVQHLVKRGQTVLYYGAYCAQWTHWLRHVHPTVRVHELHSGESIDEWCARTGVSEIHHLRLDDAVDPGTLVAAAEESLELARIGIVHLGAQRDASALAGERLASERLAAKGFRIYRVGHGGSLHPKSAEYVARSPLIALHPRYGHGRGSWNP